MRTGCRGEEARTQCIVVSPFVVVRKRRALEASRREPMEYTKKQIAFNSNPGFFSA